jgi:UDP-N-acetylglucosamine 2-epimerase (non-hydrolysing)
VNTVVHVVAARPNFVKMAPVVAALTQAMPDARHVVAHTGQHYDPELSEVFFDELELPRPDYDLAIGSGGHGAQTARALERIEQVLETERPTAVVVAGDVNSTLAAAVAAAKLEIPVAHVEAGLRSFDRTMPEEINRVLTDQISTWCFTHSPEAERNLVREGIPRKRIHFVGNTMIDTLVRLRPRARTSDVHERLGIEKQRYILATLHRPKLVDGPLLQQTIARLAELSTQLPVVLPVHPRTRARLGDVSLDARHLHLVDPVGYLDFLALLDDATAVLTDSGGVQEETTFLGVPCFTLRSTTERPVTIEQGTNRLLGLDPERIAELPALLAERRTPPEPPALWDGFAAKRLAAVLAADLGGVRDAQTSRAHAAPSVTVVTDIVTPYAVAVFTELAALCPLTVLFCAQAGSRGFAWEFPAGLPFRHRVLSGATIGRRSADAADIYPDPRILAAVAQTRPDAIVTGAFSVPSLFAAMYARAAGKPLLVQSDGTHESERRIDVVQRALRRFFARVSAGAIANSTPAAERFVELGWPADRVFLAPHSTDVAGFQAVARTRDYAANGRLSVLCVSRLIPRKGIDRLIAAAATARVLDANVSLTIAGTGTEEDALRRAAADADVPVEWLGFVPHQELPHVFAQADAFAYPTSEDPFGIAVLEAAASGLPLVVSPHAGATADFVQHTVNGLVVDPDDRAALPDALVALATDEELRRRLGQAAHRSTAERTPAATARGYYDAVQAVLA